MHSQTTEPTDLCLVDWQLCRYGSPTLDLYTHIFTSTERELRQPEYENLLKHYYNSLSTIVTKLGSDLDKLFTYDDLQHEMKRFAKFGFLIGTMMTQMITADADDISDLNEFSENISKNEGAVNMFNELSEKSQRLYVKRINDILGDLVDLGYSWK